MRRIPKDAPKSCFGLSLREGDPGCSDCKVAEGCAEHMGRRLGRVPLSEVRFDFLPEKLKIRKNKRKNPSSIDAIYHSCHLAVFGKKAMHGPGKEGQNIFANAKEAGCDVRMFVYTNMMVWKKIQPDRSFHAKMLLTDKAVERMDEWKNLCIQKFSNFNLKKLSQSLSEDTFENSLESRMAVAEERAGTYAIRYKLQHPGAPWPSLYDKYEEWLDPHWLAIEETYYQHALKDGIGKKLGEGRKETRRAAAYRIRGQLIRAKSKAIEAFEERESCMHAVVRAVLNKFDLNPDDFDHRTEVVTDPMRFWTKLGVAVQHWECVKFVEGLPSVYE